MMHNLFLLQSRLGRKAVARASDCEAATRWRTPVGKQDTGAANPVRREG